jgi:hypothetical protein
MRFSSLKLINAKFLTEIVISIKKQEIFMIVKAS